MSYGHEFYQVIEAPLGSGSNLGFNAGSLKLVSIYGGKLTIPALAVNGLCSVDITVDTIGSIEYLKHVQANIISAEFNEFNVEVVNVKNVNANLGDTRSVATFSLRIRNISGKATLKTTCFVIASLQYVK